MMFESPPSLANPIPGTSRGLERASSARKRSMEDQLVDAKRPRYSWYVKLESEGSSLASEEDTESVYSIQGYETASVHDTSDTDTKSEYSNSDAECSNSDVEYSVDDLSSDEENPMGEDGSSSGVDDILAVAGAIAVIYENSMEAWPTDGEDSDISSAGDAELSHMDFRTCIQCKSHNNNPQFRFCQKCFQRRKSLFPPRPRGHRKRESKKEKNETRKESAKDSGIGSQESVSGSQETGNEQTTSTEWSSQSSTSKTDGESSKSSEMGKKEEFLKPADVKQYPSDEENRLCILCENGKQDSVFVHTGRGCVCCCYKCAKRTWNIHKKCPNCTRKVKTILKINNSWLPFHASPASVTIPPPVKSPNNSVLAS